jgi:hypothetical protein
MTSLSDIADAIGLGQVTGVIVEVVFPETDFGGVLVEMPAEIPVQVVLGTGTGGSSGEGPTPPVSAVDSVFGRFGDVVALPGDYSLDQIAPPESDFTLAGKMRVKADGSLQLWNPDQSKWHSLSIGGEAGGEYIMIGAGET